MKTGINLLLWTTFVEERHYPLLSTLREAGYDGIELPIVSGEAPHYRELGRELDRVGLARTAITSLDVETNPASPDANVRRAAVARLHTVIDMASAAGVEVLGGPFHSAYKHFSGDPPTADEKRWSADVLRAAAERAEQAGIQLAIEMLNRFECYLVTTIRDARELVSLVDHPSLGIHYDTHHVHIEERDVSAAIELGGEQIRHVHISENDRGVPGAGQVNWADSFAGLKRIGYDGWLTIESFSRADPEFAALIHIWREFAEPEEIYTKGLAFLRDSWK